MDLSDSEKYVVKIMRQLRPFEVIEIIKDAQGRPNAFLVKRQQKVMLTELAVVESA